MFKFDTFNIDFLKHAKSAFILSSIVICTGIVFCVIVGVKDNLNSQSLHYHVRQVRIGPFSSIGNLLSANETRQQYLITKVEII